MIPIRETIAKLASQADAVPAAEAGLAGLDASEDFAAMKWARGESDRPIPDVAARRRLTDELSAARASAASAARGKGVLEAQLEKVAGRRPDILKFATSAIAEILCEEAEPMVAQIKADAIALAVRIKSLEYVSGRAVDLARAGASPVASAVAVSLVERSRRFDWDRVASAIHLATESFGVVLERQNEAIGRFREFESDLRSDAGVHFAGVK